MLKRNLNLFLAAQHFLALTNSVDQKFVAIILFDDVANFAEELLDSFEECLFIVNLSIGLCTPPVGTCLFIGCKVGKTTIANVVRPLLPFYVAMLVALVIVTFVPNTSLWLPVQMDQLKQEEAGLMSGRGLQGGPSDLQAYEIFVTTSWRKNYDKIYASLIGKESTKSALEAGRLGGLHGTANKKPNKAPPSKLVKASRKLNTFLKGFIENHQDEYRWKILPDPGLFNRFLQIPPEMGSKRMSIFLPGTMCSKGLLTRRRYGI